MIGLLTSIISQRFRIPNILLLLLIGIGLGMVNYRGAPLISFPEIFMTGISILALVMILFDSWSRLKLKKDYFALHTLWLSIIFLIFNLIFLTAFAMVIFDVSSIFLALVFSALMFGTDIGVLALFGNAGNKVFEFLKLEALLNTPFVVLLPFIILDFKDALKEGFTAQFIGNIFPPMQQLVVGIAAGVLMGLVMFKFMRKRYSAVLSPLAVIVFALLAYITAKNLGGNGVWAVASMGLLFGTVHLSHKPQLQSFASVSLNSLGILVFVLIGIIVSIDFSANFLIKSLLLFLSYILIRFASILFALRGMDFTMKEKLFMSLNVQKGIAVAVVVFSLAMLDIEGIGTVLNLAIAFMIYSIILSSVVLRIAKFFIKDVREKKG
ncbi:MAG: cation:proton antiporter [Nanoarchaeota archaeon]